MIYENGFFIPCLKLTFYEETIQPVAGPPANAIPITSKADNKRKEGTFESSIPKASISKRTKVSGPVMEVVQAIANTQATVSDQKMKVFQESNDLKAKRLKFEMETAEHSAKVAKVQAKAKIVVACKKRPNYSIDDSTTIAAALDVPGIVPMVIELIELDSSVEEILALMATIQNV